MSWYKDLSPYVYFRDVCPKATLNVGWLGARRTFPLARPPVELLDRLWKYCRWSIASTMNCHHCDICGGLEKSPVDPTEMTHQGLTLSLGSAEIRVFGRGGKIYAAPNLIFHYMVKHHYQPPDEFVRAVLRGPCPPGRAYFQRLQDLNHAWSETDTPLDEKGWWRRMGVRHALPRLSGCNHTWEKMNLPDRHWKVSADKKCRARQRRYFGSKIRQGNFTYNQIPRRNRHQTEQAGSTP